MTKTEEMVKEAATHLLEGELLEENGWFKEDIDILTRLQKDDFEIHWVEKSKEDN